MTTTTIVAQVLREITLTVSPIADTPPKVWEGPAPAHRANSAAI